MKQRVFYEILSVLIFAVSHVENNLSFWVETSLEIVFGRDFFWMDFLGRDASSDIVW